MRSFSGFSKPENGEHLFHKHRSKMNDRLEMNLVGLQKVCFPGEEFFEYQIQFGE